MSALPYAPFCHVVGLLSRQKVHQLTVHVPPSHAGPALCRTGRHHHRPPPSPPLSHPRDVRQNDARCSSRGGVFISPRPPGRRCLFGRFRQRVSEGRWWGSPSPPSDAPASSFFVVELRRTIIISAGDTRRCSDRGIVFHHDSSRARAPPARCSECSRWRCRRWNNRGRD